jgi:asparagine synthase (glutamine-hydrolysing)
MMLADMVTYLPDDILTKVDRASMAHGLEVRSPFLDDRVVEYAWALPDEMLVGRNLGKQILKDYLYRLVPRALVDRPKAGFGFPVEHWLRGRMRGWADATLLDRSWCDVIEADPKEVRAIWAGLLNGSLRLGGGVWNLLMLASWIGRQGEGASDVN